jgi:heme exporter protein A
MTAAAAIQTLQVRDLAIVRGDRLLFEDLSFDLRAGQALALVGRNGAGKTSVLRAVAGFLRPAAGSIAFLGAAGPLEPEEARAGGVHLLGHHDGIKPNRRALDEFLFQARWTGADEAGIARARAALELDTLADLEARKLSAGQRRRLALARLVASPRPLWLLDEPMAPLDAERRKAFGALMAQHLKTGGMILAAVHDPLPIKSLSLEIGG